MVITLENATYYIGIIMFTAAIVNYVIVRPLKESINALRCSIESLDGKLSMLDNKIDEYKERLVLCESSTKQAHKRLDRIDGIVDDASHRGESTE